MWLPGGVAKNNNNRLLQGSQQDMKLEPVFQQFGRTRAVATGPDGLMYVLIQNPTGSGTGLSLSAATPGMVIRLVPVS